MSIMNISYKEIIFSTDAEETNEAFFAADTGAECALYYDRSNPEDNIFNDAYDKLIKINYKNINFGLCSCALLLRNFPLFTFLILI